MYMQSAVQAPPALAFPLRVAATTLADLGAVVTSAREKLGTQARAASAALLLVLAGGLAAEEPVDRWVQDWVPAVLRMPADAEVLSDRSVGSSVRMFSVSTTEEVAPLLDEWQEALRLDGYVIDQGSSELLDGSVEFSGRGISNAKIVEAPTTADGLAVIQFDATLR
jgi:hypothetical protein